MCGVNMKNTDYPLKVRFRVRGSAGSHGRAALPLGRSRTPKRSSLSQDQVVRIVCESRINALPYRPLGQTYLYAVTVWSALGRSAP